ncbi:hypothetical protein OC846_003615 [Tilletia horrida]|uniref:Epoxide hydrolase N-terminal domain-containing protein n=1 Tax=Tilletia horrida TaxID=155126 RepID=A0AAN6GP72_9BASI|nr:hypothetical protein OC846_003615 [Tilletia horrida]KAK0565752.1 hypothetical protein OC861_003623 [Tilletia horrida]
MLLPRLHELTEPVSNTVPAPIRFGFPDAAIERIASKLEDARLPQQPLLQDVGWQYGTDLGKLRQLVAAWEAGNPAGSKREGDASVVREERPGFAAWWRGVEDQINDTASHYVVEVEGLRIHFQMKKSDDADAIPLIFSHGWPGSFYEAHRLFPLLTGSSSPSFHLIVPSLPGYGLSSAPQKPDWTLLDTSRVFHKLMTDILGFPKYVAQGGDLGTLVTRGLARFPECVAFHSNFCPDVGTPSWALPALIPHRWGLPAVLSENALRLLGNDHDIQLIKNSWRYRTSGNGYAREQQTKPATLGYALFDNPVGILSWFLQCFHEWSDPRAPAFHNGHGHSRVSKLTTGAGQEPDTVGSRAASHERIGVSHALEPINRASAVTDETILVNTTIYALADTIHTSFLPYYESDHIWWKMGKDKEWASLLKKKPYGHSSFPYELLGGPKSWIERTGVNLVFYRQHDEGGHFAAL